MKFSGDWLVLLFCCWRCGFCGFVVLMGSTLVKCCGVLVVGWGEGVWDGECGGCECFCKWFRKRNWDSFTIIA